ncbi:MAG: tyrosine-type recombinase/integrase [Clostridia bacterium]|nr:tyrosine-type recombinase/integrase [Clostridia bacterium]
MKKQNSQIIDRLIYEMELRNYSSRTIRTYSELMAILEKYYEISLDKITSEQLKSYLHKRITVDCISVSMINQTISAFKILQTDVLKRDWEQIKIKRPRREQKLPVVLSQQEVELLISSTRNIKHKALIMLAYSSGLRKQEVQLIKPSAIDSARMQVHVVQGKGKKDRYTILSKKTLELLRFYYKIEKPKVYLFEPQGQKGIPLSDTTLNNIVQKNALKAGIKKQISFHTLRHCFATHLLEQGVNLKLIQQFLGHNSLKTTSIYLSVANINPSSVVSPLDSMGV